MRVFNVRGIVIIVGIVRRQLWLQFINLTLGVKFLDAQARIG
ncbi:hypothetical protein CMMCAS08_11205 [Clavibacter michiganensis subsp. michiganensis]|nr:hypothetical protein CMMCAS04_14525 [Clavibacter michiganensis subsp. michiganensis]OUE03221.1 hypothetical protein CMMCAS08_11205 [Clavibacter michiganensis subsp. michiganensis]